MPIRVPVVAHRLFGTAFRPLTLGSDPLEFLRRRVLERTTGAEIPIIDTDHGTRRSRESIRAFFADEPSVPYTRGWNVSSLWSGSEILFELTGIEDHPIDSAQADLMHSDFAMQSRWNRRGSINVYFCREIEGARGHARRDSHPHPNRVSSGRILMGDRWHLDEGFLTREESWRGDVITFAHELGHALLLPHSSNRAHVMFGDGTTRDSVELNHVEGFVAWQHAWKYTWRSTLGDSVLGRLAAPLVRREMERSRWGRPIPGDRDA